MGLPKEREENVYVSMQKCEKIVKETLTLLDKFSQSKVEPLRNLSVLTSLLISITSLSITVYNLLKEQIPEIVLLILSLVTLVLGYLLFYDILTRGVKPLVVVVKNFSWIVRNSWRGAKRGFALTMK